MKDIVDLFNFKQWLLDRGISESTAYTYFFVLKKYLTECGGDPMELDNINAWLAKYTHKKRCTHYYSVIRSYIHFNTQNKYQQRQEMYDKMVKPKRFRSIKVVRKYLSDDKLMGILNNMDDEVLRNVAMLQILTGSRAGDVLSLRRENIDDETYNGRNVLRISLTAKGDKTIVVYLFDPVAIGIFSKYIKQYDSSLELRKYKDYVFMRTAENVLRRGDEDNVFMMQRLNYQWYLMELKKAIEQSGVVDKKYFATHDFRRCFSRKAWEEYRDVDVLQRVLNHENASTTLRYLKQSGLQNIDIFEKLQS